MSRMPRMGWLYAASVRLCARQWAMGTQSSGQWRAPRKSVILPRDPLPFRVSNTGRDLNSSFPFWALHSLLFDHSFLMEHYFWLNYIGNMFSPVRAIDKAGFSFRLQIAVISNLLWSQCSLSSAKGSIMASSCGACRQFMAEFGDYLCKFSISRFEACLNGTLL